MKSAEKRRGPLKSFDSSLENEKLKQHVSLMEKAYFLLSELMTTVIKEGQLDGSAGEEIKNLLEGIERSVSQIGRTAQHILDIASKNQKVRSMKKKRDKACISTI